VIEIDVEVNELAITYVTFPVTAFVNETATLLPISNLDPVKVSGPVVIVVEDKLVNIGLVSFPLNTILQAAKEHVESCINLLFTKTI
jgi:hypothetical protein